MCGEKGHGSTFPMEKEGSPPRVRGKVAYTIDPDTLVRITPACAGKRQFVRFFLLFRRDHPRVCGEKAFLLPVDNGALGSPPRVRGKVALGN